MAPPPPVDGNTDRNDQREGQNGQNPNQSFNSDGSIGLNMSFGELFNLRTNN